MLGGRENLVELVVISLYVKQGKKTPAYCLYVGKSGATSPQSVDHTHRLQKGSVHPNRANGPQMAMQNVT